MQSISKISGRYYLAIFVLAFATLSYQILITRFFSVMLHIISHRGHFTAMLGLTRGAMQVYGKPARYAAERVGSNPPPRVMVRPQQRWRNDRFPVRAARRICRKCALALALATIAFVAPFTEGGVCITLLLTRFALSRRWLYAADLRRRSWMSRGDPDTA